ncbi:MAG: sterol transfer family [Pseudomonadota bacterium]|jgi:putative sterol carrier protein
MSDALHDLRRILMTNFYPPAARGMDAVLRVQVGDEGIDFRVENERIEFDLEPHAAADTTFRFADHRTARALLTGEEDAFEAFMHGRFRADGYLMWAFTLMAMFRSTSLPPTPTD